MVLREHVVQPKDGKGKVLLREVRVGSFEGKMSKLRDELRRFCVELVSSLELGVTAEGRILGKRLTGWTLGVQRMIEPRTLCEPWMTLRLLIVGTGNRYPRPKLSSARGSE